MSSGSTIPRGLHFVAVSPVPGLALAERRVDNPKASVIFVHGGLDRGGSFARLARRMEHFDVIAYDRRGYQSSRDLKPFSLDLHIEDLLAVAASESKRGPVIFFGHSFGGLIALGASIANSASAQLVMCFEAPLPWVLSRDSSRPALGDDPAYEAEVFFRRMVSDGAWERLSEAERESRRLDGPGLFSDISLLRSGEVPFDLADLRVPTLYAHGDWAQKDYYRELSRVLPSLNPLISTYEVVNARHGAHLANPDQLAALIEETWSRQCE